MDPARPHLIIFHSAQKASILSLINNKYNLRRGLGTQERSLFETRILPFWEIIGLFDKPHVHWAKAMTGVVLLLLM